MPRGLAVVTAALTVVVVAGCGPPAPDCGPAPFAFDPSGDVVLAVGDDACARVERRPKPTDVCIACPYDPVRLTAATAKHRVDVDDAARLTYVASHHNWADTVAADDGDVTARVRILYVVDGDTWNLELAFLDAAGSVLEGPLSLTPP